MKEEGQLLQNQNCQRRLRKVRVGKVVSDAQQKTIVVEVERRTPHPKFKKIITRTKRYYVHDEHNEAHVGDVVRIMEQRPISKLKRWRLIEILRKSSQDGKGGSL